MRRNTRPVLFLAAMACAALAACDAVRRQAPSSEETAATSDACTRCHGTPGNGNAAPPRSVHGATVTTDVGVGAHQAHLKDGLFREAISCGECHVVPSQVESPGHMDSGGVTMTFGALASAGGLKPSWDSGAATCNSVYCHGATLPGGSLPNHEPKWTQVDGTQAACGTCHGIPPPASSGHPTVSGGTTACAGCHPGTVLADGTIDVAGGKHINGTVDVSGTACTSCHGDSTRANAVIAPAPPKDAHGNTSTTALGVGAHQSHLNAGPLRGAIACSECHVVPSDTAHSTETTPPPVIFGSLANSGGAAPAWNRASATCASTYCHGGTLSGGSITAPQWTKVDGTQAACGTCHGLPPPTGRHSDHSGRSCGDCHGGSYTRTSADPSRHVNATVEVGNLVTSWDPSTRTCVGCHGSATWR